MVPLLSLQEAQPSTSRLHILYLFLSDLSDDTHSAFVYAIIRVAKALDNDNAFLRYRWDGVWTEPAPQQCLCTIVGPSRGIFIFTIHDYIYIELCNFNTSCIWTNMSAGSVTCEMSESCLTRLNLPN